jgi:hypothetical protein
MQCFNRLAYVKPIGQRLSCKTVMRNGYLLAAVTCLQYTGAGAQSFPSFNTKMQFVYDIPVPSGFERITPKPGSFAAYLTRLPLRKNKTVYLYNGSVKTDQSLHYAVIDISTGKKDLQQCADVIMRLRAEYFYANKQFDSIRFPKNNNTVYSYSAEMKKCRGEERTCFLQFMEKVFMNCGTYTLESSLRKVKDIHQMQTGDVFIKAGAPGHAEIVVDMAVNKQTGQKIFLLAEGYMPAQDTHIVLNPVKNVFGPWYELNDDKEVVTATWTFTNDQLRRY